MKANGLFIRFFLLGTFLCFTTNVLSQKQGYWEDYEYDTIQKHRLKISQKTNSGYTQPEYPEYNHIKGGYYEIKHKLISKGEFRDNKKVNTWYSYYDTPLINQNLTRDSIVVYQSDSAIFRHMFTNEIVKSEKTYANGNLNGRYTMFYKNGNKKSEINFTENVPVGEVKLYFENGEIMFSGELIEGEDFYNGTEYYDTGAKRRDRKMSIAYVLENYSDVNTNNE